MLNPPSPALAPSTVKDDSSLEHRSRLSPTHSKIMQNFCAEDMKMKKIKIKPKRYPTRNFYKFNKTESMPISACPTSLL